jgi:hypothetical protein
MAGFGTSPFGISPAGGVVHEEPLTSYEIVLNGYKEELKRGLDSGSYTSTHSEKDGAYTLSIQGGPEGLLWDHTTPSGRTGGVTKDVDFLAHLMMHLSETKAP